MDLNERDDLQTEQTPAVTDVEESAQQAETQTADLAAAEAPQEEPAAEKITDEPQKQTYEASQWQFEEPQKKPKRPKRRCLGDRAVAVLLIVALVAGACGLTALCVNTHWSNQNAVTQNALSQMAQQIQDLQQQIADNSYTGSGNSVSGTPNTSTEGLTPGQVYAQNKYSVVAISNEVTTNIFGEISSTASSGTGFILSADGYIVTNYHVIEGADKLTVITFDGAEYVAEVIGHEEKNDLALLKVEATDLQPVKMGSSNDLIVGDQVVAIGNPLGELTNSLTVGYISAKDRTVTIESSVMNMLQTDAAINPGNSGGPLFNMKGEVVGITTAKYSGTTQSGASIEGIGFAVPIDDVTRKLADLKEFGYVTGAYLGITVQEMSPAIGIYVLDVTAGSCAEKAGLKVKDIIVGLGEYSVSNINELTRALEQFKAGDKTTLKIWRDGNQRILDIVLDEKPH